jgi:uncharacterized protein YkwD
MSRTSRRAGAALAAVTLTALLTGCDDPVLAPVAATSPATASSAAAATTTPAAPVTTTAPTTTPPTTAAPTTTTAPPTTTAAPLTTTRARPTTTTPPRTTTRTTPPPTTTTPPPAAPPVDGSVAGQVLALVNDARGGAGCPAVRLDDRLNAAAAAHSADMAANDYFDHTSRDGRSFVDRVRAQGYDAPRSENIAAGQRTPADVVAGWLDSPGHRRNILDCGSTEMGVGRADGGSFGRYWTQVFGTG